MGYTLFRKKIIWILFVLIVLVALYFVFVVVDGQGTRRVYHVGVLSALDLFADTTDGFKDGMTKLGYVEGDNIFYDVYETNVPVGNEEQLRKFVDDKVDLIFVFPTEATLEAKKVVEGSGIPIVFAHAGLEGTDVVDSVTSPGEGLTGERFPSLEVSVRRLEIIHEISPDARRIWFPYMEGYPSIPLQIEELEMVAKSLDVEIIEAPFESVEELEADLQRRENLEDVGFDAILQGAEPFAAMDVIVESFSKFAVNHQMPYAGAIVLEGDYSPTFVYNPDSYSVGQLVAQQADKIFRGIPAGSIPVVSPESNLVINYRTSQMANLTIPEGLLIVADDILS